MRGAKPEVHGEAKVESNPSLLRAWGTAFPHWKASEELIIY